MRFLMLTIVGVRSLDPATAQAQGCGRTWPNAEQLQCYFRAFLTLPGRAFMLPPGSGILTPRDAE